MIPTPPAGGAPSQPVAGAAGRPEPTEHQMVAAILEAAHVTGWRVAHFRPALTRHGWRTAVQGDGAGFPDLVMVHARARLVWWVELKSRRGRLEPAQEAWRDDLEAAGERWLVVRGRAGLSTFVDEMAEHALAAKR